MSLGTSVTAHAHDRRHSDFLSAVTMPAEPLLPGAPLSQGNPAHSIHPRSAQSVGNIYEGAIPSWVFHTGSSAMPYDSDAIHPLLSSPFAQAASHGANRSYHPQQVTYGNDSSHYSSQPLQHVPVARHSSVSDLEAYNMNQPVIKSEASFATPMLAPDLPADSNDLAASSSSRTSVKTSASPDNTLHNYADAMSHPKLAPAVTSLDPVDSWMMSNGFATSAQRKEIAGSSRSHRDESVPGDLTFKTSADRRERNKASQRESRKRKQTRLESLEDENAALRKALSATKQVGEQSATVSQNNDDSMADPKVKFSGAIHLDAVESHLEDDSAEAEWSDIAGSFFQGRLPTKHNNESDSSASSSTSVFEGRFEQVNDDEAKPSLCKNSRSLPASRKSSGARPSAKQSTWELSFTQRRQQNSCHFPAMVVVPELMLYKVCRLYFSIVLPFTSSLKSGLVNLRAARAASSYMGGCDDLPRFSGYPSMDPSAAMVLPKNLMPTEAQLRIGFHPVEIAVVPSPAMRDKLLTVLSAFQSIDKLTQDASDASSDDDDEIVAKDFPKRMALIADTTRWVPPESDADNDIVRPDKSRIYSYGFTDKPKGSHRLKMPAQRWLNTFFVDLVQNLHVWSPSGDIFDTECFEFHEPFIRKYPFMVDEQVMRSTNRWRRARGEAPIRL